MDQNTNNPSNFAGVDIELVDLVRLDRDHPGFHDAAYRQRRNEIAALAKQYVEGTEIPVVNYNATEQQVWTAVSEALRPLHRQFACKSYLDALDIFPFEPNFIPDFRSINDRLRPLNNFYLAPVAGLVTPALFLQQLGHRRFLATQYMRHHSKPLYTPEPDVIHEYIGHVPVLAHPELAELNYAFGQAALRKRATPEADQIAIEALIRVYWYTIEFGILEEDKELKVYGAGILSSVGEMQEFRKADLLAWDLPTIASADYDPTQYQSRLFVAPSYQRMRDDLLSWLDRL